MGAWQGLGSWGPAPAVPTKARWVRYSPEGGEVGGRRLAGAEATILTLSSAASPSEWAQCPPLPRSGRSLDSREHGEHFRGPFPKTNGLGNLRWAGPPPSYD